MKKRITILLLFVFALAGLSSCANNTNENGSIAQTTNAPLMWRVTAPNEQTMYLFGSIHVADASIYPLPEFIMDAFNRSDYLAVEANLLAFLNDEAAQMQMAFKLMYLDGRSLTDDIGANMVNSLADILEAERETDLLEMLNVFRPPFWTSFLLGLAVERAGMSEEYGLDLFFLQEAMTRGMEILEVESWMEQIDMTLAFSMPLQRFILHSSLDIELSAIGLAALYEAWQAGDEQAILTLLDEENDAMPQELLNEYVDAMLTQRDLHMVAMARQYMAEGKAVFYVVGLAHMIGENGIVEQLRRHGYEVQLVIE